MSTGDSNTTLTKRCSTCGTAKAVDQFSKKSRMKDGLNCQCKECVSESFSRYYYANAEKQRNRSSQYKKDRQMTDAQHALHKEKHRQWWEANKEEIANRRKAAYEANPIAREKNIARAKAWYWENKDRQLQIAKAYYMENASSIKEKVRAYEKANPEKTKALGRIKSNRRRARLLNSSEQYTRHDIERILDLQKGKCANCKCSIAKKYHIDHRVPVAKGGDNSPGNIDLLCPTCNLKKSAKLPHEFAQENGRLI